MSIQRAAINIGREQNGFAEVRSSHGYKLLNDSRTVSKSAQSKIKKSRIHTGFTVPRSDAAAYSEPSGQ